LKSRNFIDKVSTFLRRSGENPDATQSPHRARRFSTRAAVPAAPAAAPSPARHGGIVSSAHLVSPRSLELSEFEFGLIVAWNAFSRWAVRCMAAAGVPDLTITDVLLMHHISHRARNKKLADICFRAELRRHARRGLLAQEAGGSPAWRVPTSRARRSSTAPRPQGEALVQQYRAVREQCLVKSLDTELNADIGELARLLRTMSGMYDQAARAATRCEPADERAAMPRHPDARHALPAPAGRRGPPGELAMPVRWLHRGAGRLAAARGAAGRRRRCWRPSSTPRVPWWPKARCRHHHELRLPGALAGRTAGRGCRCRCGRPPAGAAGLRAPWRAHGRCRVLGRPAARRRRRPARPVQGLAPGCPLQRTLLQDLPDAGRRRSRGRRVAAAQRLVQRHRPTSTHVVLECTNLPPYAAAVQRATGRPSTT
jgi:predicted MarR family transcription regulator